MDNYVDLPETGGSGSGVTSLNGLSGALNLVAGTGITITPAGTTIQISSTTSGGTVTSVALADSTGLFNITGSPVTSAGTLTLSSFQSQSANTFLAAPNGSSGAPTFRLIVAADVPTLNQNTTGTAANITATSNSTLTTLSSLSLPGAQVTGNISGNAANITATSNSTLTTLSALSLPGSQVTGNISGNAANVTGTVAISNGGTGQTTAPNAINALLPSQTGNSGKVLSTNGTVASWISSGGTGTVTSVALADSTGLFNITGSPVTSAGTLTLVSFQSQAANTFLVAPNGSSGAPGFRLIVAADVPTLNQNTTGTAANITATSNSTLTTLSSLSLPGSQVTGNISGNAANITATSNSTLTTLSALSLPINQVTGTVVTTMGAFGSTPNANGATISTNTLTLQPADGTHPGGVSTTTQTFGGSKTLGSSVSDKTTIGTASSTAVHQINGGINFTTNTITANYTADTTTTDYYILCNASGAITVTLPAPTNGRRLIIKDISGSATTNNITIAQHSSEKIEGIAASYVIVTSFETVILTSDGTNWWIDG